MSTIPSLPSKEFFVPGKSHPSFTPMGERFIVWLGSDISKAGAQYNPGPKFSTYDSENVRKCQKAMGNEPDPPGEAYFGPRQWERLFTEQPAGKPTTPPIAGDVLRYVDEPIANMPGLRPFKANAGKPKIILHTVEGPKPNWAAKGSGTPHWTYDDDLTAYRHIGNDMAAYTLENKGGGPSPNSDAGVVIQIEMVGYAKDSGRRSDEWYAGLRELLTLICGEVGVPYEFPLTFGGDESYGYGASSRLSWDGYTRTAGIIGHQHVPKNSHWDPGRLPVGRLAGPKAPEPEVPMEPELPTEPEAPVEPDAPTTDFVLEALARIEAKVDALAEQVDKPWTVSR